MNSGDWTRKFSGPIRTKEGPAFETLADARGYIVALPLEKSGSKYWQRAAELLVAGADGAELRELEHQIRLALFDDGFIVTW